MGRLIFYFRKLCDITYLADFGFFVSLLILVSISDLLKYVALGLYYYALLLLLFYFVLVSTICLLMGLFKKRFILSSLKWLLLSIVFLQMCIDLFCWESDIPFNYHIAELIFATNINEIEEFFRAYVPTRLIIVVTLGFLLFFLVRLYVQKIIKHSSYLSSFCGIISQILLIAVQLYRLGRISPSNDGGPHSSSCPGTPR